MTFKNLPDKPIQVNDFIEVVDKQILSSSILDTEEINISLFSFADLENISEEKYSGDVLFYVVSGSCFIQIKDTRIHLTAGDLYKVNADTLHEIHANEPFRMMQITLKK